MSEGELPAQVRGLIDAAHRAPVRADRAAIRARIGTTLGATAGTTAAGALKLVMGAAISLVAVGGIYLAMHGGSSRRAEVQERRVESTPVHVESGPEHAAPAPSPIVAPVPAPSPIVAPVTAPEPTPVEHPQSSATGHAPRAHVAPPAVPSQAASAATATIDEAGLLANATRALAQGDYDHALGIVEEHARRFANGVLAEERGALELEALLGLGRGADAAVAARRFAASYPHSVHAPLVERALHQGSSR